MANLVHDPHPLMGSLVVQWTEAPPGAYSVADPATTSLTSKLWFKLASGFG